MKTFATFLSTMSLLGFSAILGCGPALAMTQFVPEEGFEYSIYESTKGELVSVGSNNNVLRWSPSGEKEQLWRFLEVGYDKEVHIQSVKSGYFLNVRWNGNVDVYPSNNTKEQKFKVLKLNATEAKEFSPEMYNKYKHQNVEFITIIESSKAERVAVGSNGNILRWAKITEPSQMFILKKQKKSVNPFTTIKNGTINYTRNEVGQYVWNDNENLPFTRVVLNPLDDGTLLKYTQTEEQSWSDGCSVPLSDGITDTFKTIFLEPCLAHDTNYDAPFMSAFFPQTTDLRWGQNVADYIFRKDMLKKADSEFAHKPFKKAWARAVAEIWHSSVDKGKELKGTQASFKGLFDEGDELRMSEDDLKAIEKAYTSKLFRDRYNKYQTVIEKGGVIVIRNWTQLATVSARLQYTSVNGKTVDVTESAATDFSVVLPISAGARNITVTSWVLGGAEIFSKTYSSPVSLAIIAEGTALSPSWSEDSK